MADDKVAIVTASAQGIGAGVVRGLHARGYRLALMSLSGRRIELAKELGDPQEARSLAPVISLDGVDCGEMARSLAASLSDDARYVSGENIAIDGRLKRGL